MKKKVISILIVATIIVLMACILASCNKQILDFNYKFEYAYIKVGDEWQNHKIDSWKDYDGEQLQLHLENGDVILISSVNCILHNGKLIESD